MPRPIAQILQEFQNATITTTSPVFKSVIVGPHRHIREYSANKSSISSSRVGSEVEALFSTTGASPTIAAVNITTYPDTIAGAVIEDASVKIYVEGWIEVGVDNDGIGSWKSNSITTATGDLTKASATDRIVLTPTGAQIFEDLGVDFSALALVPGTDILKVGADLHNIEEVVSKHRLLIKAAVTGAANKGFFTAADGAANINYSIGDNGAAYDNAVVGTTGQRILWRQVYLFQDNTANFLTASVAVGHYLKIGSDVHYINKIVDANNLEVLTGLTVVAPQTLGEFKTNDGSANIAYTIGTQNGSFKDVLDYSVAGTGQRRASTSATRYIFNIDISATQITLGQFLPFAGTVAAPLNFRIEHNITDANKPTNSDGWEINPITVNPTTKAITVPGDSTVVYAGGPRKVISALCYVQYSSLRQDKTAEIAEITSSNMDSTLGPDRKENKLRRGVGIALANAGATKIYALAVKTDDQTGHTFAQGILSRDRAVYCIVPLTQTGSIIQSYKTHATSLSTPSKAKRRIIVAQQGTLPTTKTVSVAKINGTAESNTSLFCPTADFIADGVVAGDKIVLTSPTTNSYTVATIVSGNRLTISSGPFTGPEQAAVGAVAFSVTRTLTVAGQVTELSTIPQAFNERRVTLVWPDTTTVGSDTTEPGYYLACVVAGQVAALPSQRMTTKIGAAGVSAIANSNSYFDDDQINALIDAGYYMFEQESAQAAPYASQQYTTVGVAADARDRFLSSVKNFDFVTAEYQTVLDTFPAEWNVIEDLFGSLEDSVNAKTTTLLSAKLPKIGAPLLSLTDFRVEPHATISSKVEVWAKVKLPTVLDALDMHLIST